MNDTSSIDFASFRQPHTPRPTGIWGNLRYKVLRRTASFQYEFVDGACRIPIIGVDHLRMTSPCATGLSEAQASSSAISLVAPLPV